MAVTGQLLSDQLNVLPPSGGEGVEIRSIHEGQTGWPDKSITDFRPEWDGDVFWSTGKRPKLQGAELFDGKHLKDKIAKGARTRVHVKTISRGGFCLMVEGDCVNSGTMPSVATHPHIDVRGDKTVDSEGVANTAREKRLPRSIGMIKNNGGLKHKKSK